MRHVFWDAEQYGGYLIVPGLRLEIGGGRLIYFSCLLENQTHGGDVKVTQKQQIIMFYD